MVYPHRLAAVGCLLAVLLAGGGCATIREIEEPLADTTMMVTRAGDETSLGWASQIGTNYTIWYADRRDARAVWKPLPGAERVRGTGSTITFRDRVPTGKNRYYRLQAQPAAGQRP
jgi:hypothetical protein